MSPIDVNPQLSRIDSLFIDFQKKDKILQSCLRDVKNPDLELRDIQSIEALYYLSMNFLEMHLIYLSLFNSEPTNRKSLSTLWGRVHWAASVTHQRVQQFGKFDSKICGALSMISASQLALHTYQFSRAARIALEYLNAPRALEERSNQASATTSWIQRIDWSYSPESFNSDGSSTGWPRGRAS
ncbi:hypothetical protein SCHPADRAFT_418070 [Schizopora paradoxa]|uniref:Uncharacterized protein n=1 Tax=Schizopora paradoxa TaxID=27342 RepID=A0A0H2RLN7_9AGAM|nr:hypothetical protein SCHPADRAFT_418070 [Schizopora paradoxa]